MAKTNNNKKPENPEIVFNNIEYIKVTPKPRQNAARNTKSWAAMNKMKFSNTILSVKPKNGFFEKGTGWVNHQTNETRE